MNEAEKKTGTVLEVVIPAMALFAIFGLGYIVGESEGRRVGGERLKALHAEEWRRRLSTSAADSFNVFRERCSAGGGRLRVDIDQNLTCAIYTELPEP